MKRICYSPYVIFPQFSKTQGRNLKPGLYDKLIDQGVQRALDQLNELDLDYASEYIDPADLPARVGEAVANWVTEAIQQVPDSDRPSIAAEISTEILSVLENRKTLTQIDTLQIPANPSALLSIHPNNEFVSGPLTPVSYTHLTLPTICSV